MDEDEEEFYDSLEEDQNFYDVSSDIQSEVYYNDSDSLLENDNTRKPVVTIPLYDGETDKDNLKINKKTHESSSSKHSKTCIARESNKSKQQKKKTEPTYWNLYCQKNGIPVVENEENSIATRNITSFIKKNCFLSDTTWDAPSVFEKYVPSKYSEIKKDWQPISEEQNSNITKYTDTTETTISELQNLKSISQHGLGNPSKSKICRLSKSKSSTSNLPFRQLTLKSGTVCESKLENLRKKWDYGYKASSRNRARIVQNINKIKHAVGE